MKTDTLTGKEVFVTAPDKVGVLSKVAGIVTATGVNISAICAYEVEGVAHLRLITEDNSSSIDALKKAGYVASEHNVCSGAGLASFGSSGNRELCRRF